MLELAQCKAQAVALSGIHLEWFMFCFFLGPLASSRVKRGFSFYIKLRGANQIKSTSRTGHTQGCKRIASADETTETTRTKKCADSLYLQTFGAYKAVGNCQGCPFCRERPSSFSQQPTLQVVRQSSIKREDVSVMSGRKLTLAPEP